MARTRTLTHVESVPVKKDISRQNGREDLVEVLILEAVRQHSEHLLGLITGMTRTILFPM